MPQKALFTFPQPKLSPAQRDKFTIACDIIRRALESTASASAAHRRLVKQHADLGDEVEQLQASANAGDGEAMKDLSAKMTARGLLHNRIQASEAANAGMLSSEATGALMELRGEFRKFFKTFHDELLETQAELLVPLFVSPHNRRPDLSAIQILRHAPLHAKFSQNFIVNFDGAAPRDVIGACQKAVALVDALVNSGEVFAGL